MEHVAETAPIAAFAGVEAHGRDGLAALARSARALMARLGLFWLRGAKAGHKGVPARLVQEDFSVGGDAMITFTVGYRTINALGALIRT